MFYLSLVPPLRGQLRTAALCAPGGVNNLFTVLVTSCDCLEYNLTTGSTTSYGQFAGWGLSVVASLVVS